MMMAGEITQCNFVTVLHYFVTFAITLGCCTASVEPAADWTEKREQNRHLLFVSL